MILGVTEMGPSILTSKTSPPFEEKENHKHE
jgi:hypothetical protein